MRLKLPFQRKALTLSPGALEAFASGQFNPYPVLGGGPDTQAIASTWIQGQSASYGHLYRQQPAVRSVVDYIARNIAQLGVAVYRRLPSEKLERVDDHPAMISLQAPNPWTPGIKLIFNMVADFLVYDNAYILKFSGDSGKVTMLNVPPMAVAIVGRELFNPEQYRFYRMDGTFMTVDPANVIHIRGYDPQSPRGGFSKLETLRQELASDSTARQAKTELDKAGLMPRMWIERPADAGELSMEQLDRLREHVSNWARQSTRKVPILEDGMKFGTPPQVSPQEAELLSARKFTHQEVNAIYGLWNVPPQSQAEREQVYADVLAPYCELFCAYFDLGLLEAEYHEDDLYTRFNLDEKLRGLPVDRWAAITSSTGAPWRTRNEARALEDLPPLPGADDLIVPLNTTGGEPPGTPNPALPAPNVMPVQDPNKPPQDGSYRVSQGPTPIPSGRASTNGSDVEHKQLHVTTLPAIIADRQRQDKAIEKVSQVMERYYKRQQTAVQRKGANSANAERWNQELAADLKSVIMSIFESEGGIYLSRLGGAVFNIGKRINYIVAMANGIADAVNQVTQSDIVAEGAEKAFAKALDERVATVASTVGSSAVREARYEAAAQAPDAEKRLKTWVADTARHRWLNGETVPVNQPFSGGFEPGTPANCRCGVSVS